MSIEAIQNKKFGVLGLGLSGLATIKFLNQRGIKCLAWDDSEATRTKHADILTLSDSTDIWQELDYVVLSPGIRLDFPSPHPLVRSASRAKIICDIELFYITHPHNLYIGVSGTNGKSTTSALIHHVLVSNGIKAHLVGNIGTPILSVSPAQDEILVVEMSSYQLDLIDRTKFDVGVLLNVTEDHLDHHGSMERYIQAKMRLFKNHGHEEVAVLGMDNEVTKQACSILKQRHIKTIEFSAVSKVKGGIAVLDSVVYDDINHAQTTLAENKALRGEHNAENIAACYAVLCSRLQGADIASAIASFKGLPHRIQYVGTHDNIDFINDSKATNADSTEKALKMFDNVYWIAGGLPKTDGIEPLRPLFSKVRKAFLIGTAQEEFARTLEEEGVSFIKAGSLESAFKLAVEEAERDTSDQTKVVLLSPACASWDQWKSFEERGNKFIHLTEQYCHP